MKAPAKPDAWMPLYVGDWDGDTGHLDCEQDGAYGRLVRHYWRCGALIDDDRALARIVRTDLARWRRLRPALEGFFQVGDGRWRHRRVEAELEAWTERKARYVARASAGGRAKAAKGRGEALPGGCPSSSSSSRVEEGAIRPSSRSGRGIGAGAGEPAPPRAFAGPCELRAAVAERMGEAYARSWLDPAGWAAEGRAIVCRLDVAARRLSTDLGPLLAAHGAHIVVEGR